MTCGRLGRQLRQHARERLNRATALRVTQSDRTGIRLATRELSRLLSDTVADVCLLPISSLEWSSELRQFDHRPVIILDLEQVNALSYIVYRESALDRPIFHYCEYLSRASELLIGIGDTDGAIRTAQTCHNRLAQYVRQHGTTPLIPRPINAAALEPLSAFLGTVMIGFVLGHEMGHVALQRDTPLLPIFAAIEECWGRHQSKAWSWGDGPSTTRFIIPSIVQKLDDHGLPAGNISLTTPRVHAADRELECALAESKADALGLLVCSRLAQDKSLPAPRLLFMLIHTLCAIDRLSILRRVVPQLPRSPHRCAIDFQYSRVASRLYMLLQVIIGIADGEIVAPPDIARYWCNDPQGLDLLRGPDGTKYIEHITMGSDACARGGVYLGTGAEFPAGLPSDDELMSQYGPIVGANQMAFYWPFRMPPELYSIPDHWNWAPGKGPPGLIGFGSAVRDITNALMSHVPVRNECGLNYRRRIRSGDDLSTLVRRIRHHIGAQSLAH